MTAAVFRVVLDTNEIVAAGSRWLDTGAPSSSRNEHLRLLIIVATRHKGLYCDEILDEYARVLLRRRHPPERVRRLLAYIQGAFSPAEITSSAAPIPPGDPDDEIFLLCALDGDADFLVSEDGHLLELRQHYKRPLIVACSDFWAHLDPNRDPGDVKPGARPEGRSPNTYGSAHA